MSFKTQQEIWEYLIGGGKVREEDWSEGWYVFLENGTLKDNINQNRRLEFSDAHEWQPYKEPQKTKKFYQWVFEANNGDLLNGSGYACDNLKDPRGDFWEPLARSKFKRKLKETEVELPVCPETDKVLWDLVESSDE